MNLLLAMYVKHRPLWVLAKDRRIVEVIAIGQQWEEGTYKWVPYRAIREARKPPKAGREKPWLIIADFPTEALTSEIKRVGWRLISPEGYVYG